MASFNGNEMSSMISSKKYRVKKNDNLSTLAEKFQNSFPSAKCMNKMSLEDKIYKSNSSAFGGNKNLLFEGEDLILNFLCDCRCHLKINKSGKDYVFTDEDKLSFQLHAGRMSFWDDFCHCDKDVGNYLKAQFMASGRSSLPDKLSLNVKISGTATHKELVNELKRSAKEMISTEEIALNSLKLLGANSVSTIVIRKLAFELEMENHIVRNNTNIPVLIPKKEIDKLSTNSIMDIYKKIPYTGNQKQELEKGCLTLSKSDTFVDKKTIQQKIIANMSTKCVFMEEIPNSYAGFKMVLITEAHIKEAMDEFREELTLFKNFGKMIIGKELGNMVLRNWAKVKIYDRNKRLSLSEKSYTIKEAKSTIADFSAQDIWNPLNSKKLLELVYSLMRKQAKALEFDKDDESLRFLVDFNTLSDSKTHYNSISTNAQKDFIDYLKQTFHELGSKYVPVVITDGFRTILVQVHRMTEDKDLPYYLEKLPKNGGSYPYVKHLHELYSLKTTKQGMLDILNSTANPYKWNSIIKEGAKDDIKEYLIPNNKESLKTTLEELMTKKYFFPSYHMSGQALDLSDNGEHKDTAQMVLKKAGQKYESDHVHINLN